MKIVAIRDLLIPLTAGVLAASLGACGVSTSESTPADTVTTLNQFDLIGNEPNIVQVRQLSIPMDKNERASALFSMSWDVTSSDPYRVVAHISDDPSLVLDVSDQVFLDMQCGSDYTQYNCDELGDLECSFRYEPDYVYATDPLTGDYILDSDGNRIRLTNTDGSYQITAHHYYLGCGNGPGDIRQAEITNRVLAAGFPATDLNQYIVFTATNGAGDGSSAALVQLHIYDSLP